MIPFIQSSKVEKNNMVKKKNQNHDYFWSEEYEGWKLIGMWPTGISWVLANPHI